MKKVPGKTNPSDDTGNTHERSRLLSTAVEQSGDGIAIADRKGNLLFVNQAWAKLHGYDTSQELIGRKLDDFHNKDQLDSEVASFKQIVARQETHSDELGRVKKNGQTFVSLTTSSLIVDRDGEPTAHVIIVKDVTGRKEMELRLIENERRLREAQKMIGLGTWILDVKTRQVWWSDEVFRIFNLDPEEFTPQLDSILELSPWPGDRDRDTEIIQKAMESREMGSYEQRFLRQDKSIGYYFSTFQGKYDESGDLIGMIGTVQDITDRKKAEIEKQMVIENSPVPMAIIDNSGNILSFNRKFTSLYGYTTSDLQSSEDWWLAAYPDEVYRENTRAEWESAAEEARATGAEVTPQEQTITAKDGSQRIVEFGMIHLGELSVVTAIDITERVYMETQLRQSQKMDALGTLAGGIAHDFNNMLAAIIGNSDLAMKSLPEDHPARSKVERVLEASTRARDLVGQILTFSRKSDQDRKPILLENTIREVFKMLRATIPTTIEMNLKVISDGGTILANPTQIHQVLTNLTTNAVHAMGGKGWLEFRLRKVDLTSEDLAFHAGMSPGGYSMISISDTGSGMDQSEQQQIFDPFYTTKEFGQGIGMGLAIVHGIVTSHGGMITVESTPGKGTTFRIYFPLVDKEPMEPAEETNLIQTGNETILVVDDEELLASMLHQALELNGYRVTSLTDSTKALNTFLTKPDGYDLIITDQSMPNFSGAELAKEALAARPDIPIILTTGYSEAVSEDLAQQIGIRRFCMKPLKIDQLLRIVRQVLDEDTSKDL